MEYLEGETLAKRLSKGPLPLDRLLRYGVQIASALEEAHTQGIIHRDESPGECDANEVRCEAARFWRGEIAGSYQDRLCGRDRKPDPLSTERGVLVGTLAYMSPEQLRGEELDARTDLFSFGSVLYEMATGIRAFPGARAVAIDALLNRDPLPPRQMNEGLPERLEVIVGKAMQKDRRLRYQAAAEIQDDLAGLASVQGGRTSEKRREAGFPARTRGFSIVHPCVRPCYLHDYERLAEGHRLGGLLAISLRSSVCPTWRPIPLPAFNWILAFMIDEVRTPPS